VGSWQKQETCAVAGVWKRISGVTTSAEATCFNRGLLHMGAREEQINDPKESKHAGVQGPVKILSVNKKRQWIARRRNFARDQNRRRQASSGRGNHQRKPAGNHHGALDIGREGGKNILWGGLAPGRSSRGTAPRLRRDVPHHERGKDEPLEGGGSFDNEAVKFKSLDRATSHVWGASRIEGKSPRVKRVMIVIIRTSSPSTLKKGGLWSKKKATTRSRRKRSAAESVSIGGGGGLPSKNPRTTKRDPTDRGRVRPHP